MWLLLMLMSPNANQLTPLTAALLIWVAFGDFEQTKWTKRALAGCTIIVAVMVLTCEVIQCHI
jgi:Mg2+/citrate symporter